MDYVHKEVELEFRDSHKVCENITIIDDDAVERDRGTGRENFFAELESRSPNVRIGGSGTTEISIEDNDGM